MRKMLLVAITLTLMTSAVAQADEVVEVYIGENQFRKRTNRIIFQLYLENLVSRCKVQCWCYSTERS